MRLCVSARISRLSLIHILTNTALNWVLIYGQLGFPALGIAGAAIATLISGVVNLGFIVVACLWDRNPYLFRFSEHFRWNKAFLKQFFAKSSFIVGNEAAMGAGNMLSLIHSFRAAALDHETGDHAVEDQSVVKALFHQ